MKPRRKSAEAPRGGGGKGSETTLRGTRDLGRAARCLSGRSGVGAHGRGDRSAEVCAVPKPSFQKCHSVQIPSDRGGEGGEEGSKHNTRAPSRVVVVA
ncbi:hypothetical protein LZ30DRAFT_16019 [Colletotrichum cereale]|nr:hypothetical protein LZ30DRAFT_16019 [Colletotrichum cereale]